MKKQTPVLFACLTMLIIMPAHSSPIYEGKNHRITSHVQTEFGITTTEEEAQKDKIAEQESGKDTSTDASKSDTDLNASGKDKNADQMSKP